MTEYDTALEALKASTEEMVSANQIAPILHMNPGVIVKYAKDGTWNQDTLGKFVISGDRVKFFRRDFLQKCGFLEPEPEEKSTETLILEQLGGGGHLTMAGAQVRGKTVAEAMELLRGCIRSGEMTENIQTDPQGGN